LDRYVHIQILEDLTVFGTTEAKVKSSGREEAAKT
jgi:hypothetical protein